jgi:SAM-dependent methyltransferase
LAKTYRKIQHWDRWLGHFPGESVLTAEKKFLPHLLAQYYGNQALLIGTPRQHVLLKSCDIPNQYLLTPLLSHGHHGNIRTIESELHELPVASGSIDLVVLPHILEQIDNPRQLLSEACRIIKPEGHIIICGFNPHSLWGLKKLWVKNDAAPWSGNFINASSIKKWLGFADFELMKQSTLLFRPPVNNESVFNKLKFLEWFGRKSHIPFGGVYTLVAQAKVIPLTPIKLRWQQKLYDVKLRSIGMPKPTVRNHPR